ncbi:hypothetical protein DE146DRAFT_171077 [Phaeosphaeria sp. MPI-PUGE-AT-0046c]|nr:hypothetical protein DE146DRAFT_171077 [Phaeosphaeria sp. MPI-PUGE-AT-0046c]
MSSSPFFTGKMGGFQLSEARSTEARPVPFPRPASYPRPSSADSSWRQASPPSTSSWRRHSATASTSPPRSLRTPQRTPTPPRRDSLFGSESGNWRVNAAPLKSLRKPSFDDVKLGMVFHLPGKQNVKDSLLSLELNEPNRPWDHPAVVVGKFVQHGQEFVEIRGCTTFHGQQVEAVKPKHQQSFFLLADNDEDVAVHGGTRLGRMAPGSTRFCKRTYVNLSWDSLYPVKYEHLELHNGKLPIQFDQDAVDMIQCRKPF